MSKHQLGKRPVGRTSLLGDPFPPLSLSCALNAVLLFGREQRAPLCPALSQVGFIAWMTQHRWPGYLFPTTPKSPCVPPAQGLGARVTLPASSGREKRLGARSIPSCPSALVPELLGSLLVAFLGFDPLAPNSAPPARTFLGHRHCCAGVLLFLVANARWREQTLAILEREVE